MRKDVLLNCYCYCTIKTDYNFFPKTSYLIMLIITLIMLAYAIIYEITYHTQNHASTI